MSNRGLSMEYVFYSSLSARRSEFFIDARLGGRTSTEHMELFGVLVSARLESL